MNTLEVENLLRADCKLSTIFEGVYASDLLPSFCESRGTAMVMNMDPSNFGGSHWVCLYIEKGRGEYFDSYGLAPPLEEFVSFLNRNCRKWEYNKQELQSLDTTVCGHYCIWFLSERARGKSMLQIVEQFSSTNTRKNDVAVENLVLTRFGRISAAASGKTHKCVQCCCARVRCLVK